MWMALFYVGKMVEIHNDQTSKEHTKKKSLFFGLAN